MNNRPVGIFDSGVGGISVLKAAMAELPNENFIYYGDNAHMPYGERPHEEIKRLAFACAQFLTDRGAKAIVVACNTATSAAIDDIRKAFPVPVISMEPAIKPALERTRGKVLMLATPNTCELDRYVALRKRLDGEARVIDVGCRELAPRVNAGRADVDDIFEECLFPYKRAGVTAIVLGCTHYPFVRKQLEDWCSRNMEGEIQVFDGRFGTARQLRRVLEREDLLCGPDAVNRSVKLYTSGDESIYMPIMHKLFDMADPFA